MKLDKRDFDSPIPHLVKKDLQNLDKKDLIEAINKNTEKVFSTKYLDDYFIDRSLKETKEIFFGI
jgi:hypothetical protein